VSTQLDHIRGIVDTFTGDIRWLLEHNDCPSYPLILIVFAGIEFVGKCTCQGKRHSDSAIGFMEKYMTGYGVRLPDGRKLPIALYQNLRSAIVHHGGARGGILVSHEESAIPFHLRFCEDGGKHFVVYSRALAEDFLFGAEKAMAELMLKDTPEKKLVQQKVRSMDQGYRIIPCPSQLGPLESPPFKGTDASET
jgi:hypothetical protein